MASKCGGAKPSKSMASVIAQMEKSGAAQRLLPTSVTAKPFVPNLKPVGSTGSAGGAGVGSAAASTAPPKIALKPPVNAAEKPSPALKKVTPFKPTEDTAFPSTGTNALKSPGTSIVANKTTPQSLVSTKPDLKTIDTVKKPAWKKPSPIDSDKTEPEAAEKNLTGDRRSSPPTPTVTSAPAPAVKTFGVGARATLPRLNQCVANSSTNSDEKEESMASRIKRMNEIVAGSTSSSDDKDNDSHNDSSPKPAPGVAKKFSAVVTSTPGQRNVTTPSPIAGKLNVAAAWNGAAKTDAVKTNPKPSWIKNNNEDKPVNNLSNGVSSVLPPAAEKEKEKEDDEEEEGEDYENLNETPTLPPPFKPQMSANSNSNKNSLRPPAKSPSVQPTTSSTLTKSPSTASNKENTEVVVHAATGKRYRLLAKPRTGNAKPPKKIAKPLNIELERFREPAGGGAIADDEEMYEDASSESVTTGTHNTTLSSGNSARGGGGFNVGGGLLGRGGNKVEEASDDQEIYEAVD